MQGLAFIANFAAAQKIYTTYMKIPYCILLSMFAGLSLLSSCGEDRTYEYEELTAGTHWIETSMRQNYLWNDSISSLAWKDYFAEPSDFLSRIIPSSLPGGQVDSWSYCIDSSDNADPLQRGHFNHKSSYGIDFVVQSDPTGATNRSYARVTMVYPGSPADRCGLRRNDFIASVGGERVSTSNVALLESGKSTDIAVGRIGYKPEEAIIYWTSEDTLKLQASEYVEDTPFMVDTVYDIDGTRIAYLMDNRLVKGPDESAFTGKPYMERLDEIFAEFKRRSVSGLVLDLRNCSYGDIDCALQLASYIVPSSAYGSVFCQTYWNSINSTNNKSYVYDASLTGGNGLNLPKVCIITGGYTCGAAEWLIHSLRATMGASNVVLVGTSTLGQNVMTMSYASDYGFTICPVVAYVADSNGDYDYSSGITPDVVMNEFEYIYLNDYGAIDEVMLNAAIAALLSM